MTTRRSEHLRRLTLTGAGRMSCDQRPGGGELWLIERHGRDQWAIRPHRPAPRRRRFWQAAPVTPPATIVALGALRGWVNARADELERPIGQQDGPIGQRGQP